MKELKQQIKYLMQLASNAEDELIKKEKIIAKLKGEIFLLREENQKLKLERNLENNGVIKSTRISKNHLTEEERSNIIADLEIGLSQRRTAVKNGVSLSVVTRLWKKHNEK